MGSGLIIALYGYFVITRLLSQVFRIGRIETRLLAVQENWFDHWRILLDKPMVYLLLFTSLASLSIVIYSWKFSSRETIRALN